jgi:hypothetical protein
MPRRSGIYRLCQETNIPLPSIPVTTPIKLYHLPVKFINHNVLRDVIFSNLHQLEICALLEFYTTLNGSFLPTFWNNLKALYSIKQSKQNLKQMRIIFQSTYLLTPWSQVLLEKLTSHCSYSRNSPHFYGTRKFFTVLTSARHPSLS